MLGCTRTGGKNEPKITIGDKAIKYMIVEDNYSTDEAREDLFKFAFGEEQSDYIKYLNINEKVYIDFGNNPPDEFIIKDHLLNSEGELMYTEREILDVPVNGDNRKYYFVVNKHLASALRSNYEENKKDYRGITVITNTGGIEKVYVFVIKTDR